MEKVRSPVFKIFYTNRNITEDVSNYLEEITYSDSVEGETDEIEIKLSDQSDIWKNAWYPTKGDRLKLQMGYDSNLADCGEFEIDNIGSKGPPDIFTIKGLATWVTSALRTKKTFAYDGQTIKEIAQKVCNRNGLKLTGEFHSVRVVRSNQFRETDLAYLKRISQDFGFVFSIRGDTMFFSSIYKLEAGRPVLSIKKGELTGWDLSDKTSEMYSSARVKYMNPVNKTIVTTEAKPNLDGFVGTYIKDVREIRVRAENVNQAEEIAKSHLHRFNSTQQSGWLALEGNPLLVAGMNIELLEFGEFSGIYHITKSKHTQVKKAGYSTTIDIKRIGFVETSKKTKKK